MLGNSGTRRRGERLAANATARISVTLPKTTKNAIEQFAEDRGVTLGYATQHFLKIGMTAETIALEGGEVVAIYPDGNRLPVANSRGNFFYRKALESSN